MKARGQRTHYMGYSNRNTSISNQNQPSDIFQKSFNKSKSQYYNTTNKVNSIGLMTGLSKDNQNNQKTYISQQNINTLYKDAEKGHHHEFESKKFKNQKNLEKLYDDIVHLAPLPLTYTTRLNSQLKDLKNDYKDKQINLHKVREMKKMFLRNNEKRRNLKEYFQQYASQSGIVNMQAFKKLIKDCGYYMNDTQIELVFRLNKVHDGSAGGNQHQGMNLPQFVNLMTKENVYFKTLRLQDTDISLPSSYRLSPPEFQIFRNSFPKLKQALKVYNGQPITRQNFQKIMKRLDITDLVLKQHNRTQIFNQFSTPSGQLNAQQLLGLIATQQHQRISRQQQMKVSNHDGFEKNLPVNEEFLFEKKEKKDPLLDLLYPVNLKKTSFVDYERSVKSAKEICDKIKMIKEATKRDVMKELCSSATKINKDDLFKRVQSMLLSQGYNFSKNEYKSFLSYIDFDSTNNISSQKLQNIILKEDQRQRVNRLDRRVRNQEVNHNPGQYMQQQDRIPQDQFVDKMRSRSSVQWNSAKKTFIKEANVPQFKTTTKFSAWPDRLYQTDFSLVQAKSTFGMGITEHNRFHKEEKHSFAQEDRLRKLRNYESKVRKVAEWQDMNDRKIQERSVIEERKELGKQYNMRLLKEQYENKCHSNSMAH